MFKMTNEFVIRSHIIHNRGAIFTLFPTGQSNLKPRIIGGASSCSRWEGNKIHNHTQSSKVSTFWKTNMQVEVKNSKSE